MKIEIEKAPNCVIALIRCNDGMSFQGAGKNQQEAISVMWALYNNYYKSK